MINQHPLRWENHGKSMGKSFERFTVGTSL